MCYATIIILLYCAYDPCTSIQIVIFFPSEISVSLELGWDQSQWLHATFCNSLSLEQVLLIFGFAMSLTVPCKND